MLLLRYRYTAWEPGNWTDLDTAVPVPVQTIFSFIYIYIVHSYNVTDFKHFVIDKKYHITFISFLYVA